MEEQELAQGGHKHRWGQGSPQQQGARAHSRAHPLPQLHGLGSPAAASSRGQSGGGQLSDAALTITLTSTRKAMAGTSQRGFFLLSSWTR